MSDTINQIKKFIGEYERGVVSFLSTVNQYDRSTIRQVSTFVDFENHAISLGANAETVSSTSELEAAYKRAKDSSKTYVIVIKTHGYEWLEGSAFWESPTLQDPLTNENKDALKDFESGKSKQRRGV